MLKMLLDAAGGKIFVHMLKHVMSISSFLLILVKVMNVNELFQEL